uniref:Uncharacterized protein n=1 Tax=Panagrolaimus sp. JU765 TaxID=591449 RepID=A0AC34Q010_9BILA
MASALVDEPGQLVVRCPIKELSICHSSILDEHLKLAKMDDPNIVFDVKRMIGKSFEEVLKINGNKWPFEVVEHRSSVEINLNGTKMAPEFVLSKLLENLVEDAEKELNEPIREAVIAVPTNFDEKQKDLIKASVMLAGIQVTELVDELVAAFYDFKRTKIGFRPGTVVFIADLGGGAFDAAVIEDNPTKPEICSSGNAKLGGRDFDAIVVELITEKINAKFPKYADLLQQKSLIFQAEAVKIQLSTKKTVE